jgi:uncharacterized protein YcbK (DUF882 family)
VFRTILALLLSLSLIRVAAAQPIRPRAPLNGAPRLPSKRSETSTRSKGKSGRASRRAPVVLFQVNTRESLQLRLRDNQGRAIRGQQKRFNRFLRCHQTNAQHAMNPRLIKLIYETGRHWPGRRIEVVSGYRHPTVAKNPRSPHMKGLACDFRVAGVANADLRDYLRQNFTKVGVGYYPNSSFVHLDVRPDRSAFWIDYSGPGERALYSEARGQDLKTGRADQYHPSKIDSAWIDDGDGPNNHQPVEAQPPAAPSEQPAGAPVRPAAEASSAGP